MIELYYYENSICAERVLMTLVEKQIKDWIPHHLHLFKGEQFSAAYLTTSHATLLTDRWQRLVRVA